MMTSTPIKNAVLAAVQKCEESQAQTCYRTFAVKDLGRDCDGKPVYAIAAIELNKGCQPEVIVNVESSSDLVKNADPKTDPAGVFSGVTFDLDSDGYLTDEGYLVAAQLQQELALLSGVCKTNKHWALTGLFPETAGA